MEKLLKVKEVAERLNVSESTIKRWCNDGTLKASKFGRGYRIEESDLEEFIKNSKIN